MYLEEEDCGAAGFNVRYRVEEDFAELYNASGGVTI
jgi:hypothetical protein